MDQPWGDDATASAGVGEAVLLLLQVLVALAFHWTDSERDVAAYGVVGALTSVFASVVLNEQLRRPWPRNRERGIGMHVDDC